MGSSVSFRRKVSNLTLSDLTTVAPNDHVIAKINIRSICLVNSPIRLSGPMEPHSLEELARSFPPSSEESGNKLSRREHSCST